VQSLDTNIIARLIVEDDVDQHALAAACFSETVFVAPTVLMELGWLMQSRYKMDRAAVADSLRDVLSMEMVITTNRLGLDWAIDRFEAGADLADVIHVAVSTSASAFVSFDRKLAKHAGKSPPIPIKILS
jgi:predicted nucleic-acid-binding protein